MFILKEGAENGKGTSEEVKKSILSYLADEGYVIRTKQEDKTYLDNRVQDEVDSIMSKRNRQITDDVKELTGINPGENEKYYDYLKRAFKEKNSSLQQEVEKLKESNNKGDNDQKIQALESQISELENKLSSKEDEITNIQTEYAQKQKQDFKQRTFENFLNGKRDKFKDLEGNLLTDITENRKRKILENHEIVEKDGQTIIYDKDGKPVRDNSGQPIKADDFFTEQFKDLFDESKFRSGAGTGSGSNGQNGQGNEKPYQSILESMNKEQVTDKVKLYDYLRDSAKLQENSKEFNEAYNGISKDLELPLRSR